MVSKGSVIPNRSERAELGAMLIERVKDEAESKSGRKRR